MGGRAAAAEEEAGTLGRAAAEEMEAVAAVKTAAVAAKEGGQTAMIRTPMHVHELGGKT